MCSWWACRLCQWALGRVVPAPGRRAGVCFFFSSRRRHTRCSRDWSSDVCSSDLKEVVGHVMDTERVFCYRALAFGRGDANPLPGFDEKAWVPPGRFDARPLKDLVVELDAVRRATIALFSGLDADALQRRGTANNNPITVRALAWIIVGHERHHVGIVRERYLA